MNGQVLQALAETHKAMLSTMADYAGKIRELKNNGSTSVEIQLKVYSFILFSLNIPANE